MPNDSWNHQVSRIDPIFGAVFICGRECRNKVEFETSWRTTNRHSTVARNVMVFRAHAEGFAKKHGLSMPKEG